jgi:hypothetical protein
MPVTSEVKQKKKNSKGKKNSKVLIDSDREDTISQRPPVKNEDQLVSKKNSI